MALPAGVTQLGTFKGKQGDKGDKGEPGGEPSAIVDWMSDPDSAPGVALDTLIRDQVQPLWATAGLVVIFHGTDISAPRVNSMSEEFDAPALWVGTVVPANRAEGDFFFYSTGRPMPLLVWSETASTPGTLITTEVGALPWAVGAASYVAAKSGGVLKFTSTGTSVGSMTVNDALTDCTFKCTISNAGPQFEACVFMRWMSSASNLVLNRKSGSDGTYIINERVSSAQTTLAELTGFVMADGDQIEVITKADGTLIISINGVLAYDGNIATHAAATARGVGVRTPTSALLVGFDDLSVWTPA